MASKIKVNEIVKQSGSSISIGESGDTLTFTGTPSFGTVIPVASGGTGSTNGANAPYFSAMRAEGSGVQSIADSTWTKITFPTTIADSASAWASNEQWTVPAGKGGLYFVSACVYWAGGANNIAAALKIYINGDSNPLPNDGTTNTNATLSYYANGEDSSNNFMSTGSGTFRLNAGDYIELYAWHDKGSAMNAEPSGTRATAFRIGDV